MDSDRTPVEAVLEALLVIEQGNLRAVYQTKGAMQVAWSAMSKARAQHRGGVKALRHEAERAGRDYSRAYVAHQESLRVLVAARSAASCPSLPAGVNLPMVEG